MSQKEFEFLTHDKVRNLIEAHKEVDPIEFALTHHNNDFPTHLVSQQFKSLQKARKKLPLWYQSKAILPDRALEQASSEQTAFLKQYQGESLLDLTCGLGVDSHFLSQGFRRCIALEADPVLAQVSCYNFDLLENNRVEVKNLTAEQFLTHYEGLPFDLTEAHRLFPLQKELRVISIDNECKELLIDLNLWSPEEQNAAASLRLEWIRKREYGSFTCSFPVETKFVPATDETPLFLLLV